MDKRWINGGLAFAGPVATLVGDEGVWTMIEVRVSLWVVAGVLFGGAATLNAALLAYEPFTNATGAAIVESSGGFGFSGGWQANGSVGVATNTAFSLGYQDGSGNWLVTCGGAGFFQGSATASTAMQPFRLCAFSRGTNGVEGTSTWVSFLAARQGPTGTLSGNPYGRGANVAHDLNTGAVQKLAVGNSSGATSNSVGLIPQGSGANLLGSSTPFGGQTNFVVVRIDHRASTNDVAYLFLNPALATEPQVSAAGAVSSNSYDFSFDRVRVFAGGQSSAQQPYAELVLDEYRVGETYADVAPFNASTNLPAGPLRIGTARGGADALTLAGTGGSSGDLFYVLASSNLSLPLTNWVVVATNTFDVAGNFLCTNLVSSRAPWQFFRLFTGTLPPSPFAAPMLTTQPTNQTAAAGQTVTFGCAATGTMPLQYQWFFNTNTCIGGATNAILSLTNVQDVSAGSYHVVVTNNFGAVTSTVALLTVIPAIPTNALFIALAGSDSNPGTFERPFRTFAKALSAVGNGGLIYVRGGVYAQPGKLSLSKTAGPANTIRLWAYPGETPVVDSAGNTSDGISISGTCYHLKGLTVRNAGHNGINISGHSNTVEFCTVHDNSNTGLHITGGSGGTTFPSFNLILNCDSYHNYDPPIGGNADGFSAKWDLGPGNVFRGCRAWENSDDGWDLWMGNAAVVMDGCWAFRQGTNYWASPDFNGNGNGFKLGGNYVGAPHRLVRCVAFDNHAHGIDQNNNILGQTIDQNTSWSNGGRNFNLNHGTNTTPHVVRNNLSVAGTSGDSFSSGTLATKNSWQVLSPAANLGDLQSADASVATGPRQPDGSLPVWTFLRPVPGGRLIDKGLDIGEPFYGSAPDLGAFEIP